MVLRLLCIFLLLFPSPAARAQGSCSPPALGHPCSAGGVATQGATEPGLNLGIGNPVNLATGNKHQQELDLPANPASPLLQIQRHYNSLDHRHGAFGRGWSLSYDTRLYHAGGRYQIIQADGSRIDFGPGKEWPLRNRHGLLQPDGTQWLWTWPDGRQLRFDRQGRLIRIAAPPENTPTASGHEQALLHPFSVIDIVRHARAGPLQGAIAHIAASPAETQATLRFHYRIQDGRAYISAIDTPLGRLRYIYEPAVGGGPAAGGPVAATTGLRLVTFDRPDGLKRHYLYETDRQAGNAFLVTGIELASRQGERLRIHSWAYDSQGRAVLSAGHYPRSYTLRISYARAPAGPHNGLTLVNGAGGGQTRFHYGIHAGRHALLQVEGAPCPGCAAPGSVARYDAQGRLQQLNDTGLLRHASGHLQRLLPAAPGWPGLRLDFDARGRRHAWHADLTGTEKLVFDDQGRPAKRLFANGDEWHYRYDTRGRPRQVTAHNRDAVQVTRLRWDGERLAHVRHPHENESRQYDSHGRLTTRTIHRPFITNPGTATYIDRFEYGPQHRIVAHHLPEGGALLYGWNESGRLMRIDWLDAAGQKHNVIKAWPAQTGYQYGNGLRLALHIQQKGARALALYDNDNVIWDHFRAHDVHDRPSQEFDRFNTHLPPRHWSYVYDDKSRLAVATVSSPSPESTGTVPPPLPSAEYWHAWHDDGAARAVRHGTLTFTPQIERDAGGLPRKLDGFELRYGPHRRLEQVRLGEKVLDRYRHNAFGHRIQAITPTEQMHYFYLDSRLVAESRQPRTPASRPDGRLLTRRYIHAQHALVGIIDYSQASPSGVLYAVHADLMGAPRIVTDAARQIRWLAEYTPTGGAKRIMGDLRLDLRLPGQIANATTGWHDNLLRTYVPRFGHYLEPDPLGPLPGSQALGYGGQQPRRYIDPLGLLLFAFDGTRQNMHNRSNVWHISQRYQDGPVFYHSGPGNPYYWDLDALAAHTAPQTIETQWQHLLNALHAATPRADQTIPIDIIGYSRGAALARHFGNLVEQHVDQGLFSYADSLRGQITACVDLRFMGLFDTVAQFGLGGALNAQYDFSISAAWGWVAHAVALHERRWLFPLLAATHGLTDNVVEAPFIGAHADIGGGVPQDEKGPADTHGDLSDIALNWMIWQARAASVPLAQPAPEQAIVSHPVLHDQRSALARTVQEGDRRVDTPAGNKQHPYQDDHQRLGRLQRQATEALITRYENWRSNDSNAVGIVDMDAYARWLYDELGWHATPTGATGVENNVII